MTRRPPRRSPLDRLHRAVAVSQDESRPPERRKKACRDAAHWAVIAGVFLVPKRCERCRQPATLEKHHGDYRKPLVFEFLCWACHRIADGRVRESA